MLKYVSVYTNLFAPSFSIAALEFNFREKISCNSIHFLKLRIRSTERTVVWVFGEPMPLAVSTNWFLANFTFEGVFQNVVAYSANQFW